MDPPLSDHAPPPEPRQAPPSQARPNRVLAACRGAVLLGVLPLLYLAYALLMLIKRGDAARFAHATRWTSIWAHVYRAILGLRLRVHGLPEGGAPPGCMLAPNHTSYLDIVALSAIAPCFFVPKGEIATWPLLSTLTRASLHPFIRRASTRAILATSRAVADRLRAGQRICVFLEGTTTKGDRLLPFRPLLLEPAIELGAPVVPVAIDWRVTRPEMSVPADVAYWADHDFVTHVGRLLGLGGVEVELRFGEPIATAGRDRRELATQVRAALLALRRQQDPGLLDAHAERRDFGAGG